MNREDTSWWTDQTTFESRKGIAAARMRRAPLPTPVQRYFDSLLDREEMELMGTGGLSLPAPEAPSSTRSASTTGRSILSGEDSLGDSRDR